MIKGNVQFETTATKMLADIYTPVGIYLRIRDSFRDSVLMESTDFNEQQNAYSFIGIKAIAGIEATSKQTLEYRLPNDEAKVLQLTSADAMPMYIQQFMQCFVGNKDIEYPLTVAQGLLGYFNYDSVQLFETITFNKDDNTPLVRLRFYQYIIAINHFKDELYLIENTVAGVESERAKLETLLQKKDVPQFDFTCVNEEQTNMTDEEYMNIVKQGIAHCQRGDVFQVVLSRQFKQHFLGDDFNVYRALRSINPSPYLFYFDYGSYRIFGSSPESQLIVQKNVATIHPIAGTVRKTGDKETDDAAIAALQIDAKENAEHTMLVDLARNDLSVYSSNVEVMYYKTVKQYSHLVHLVSEVQAHLETNANTLSVFGKSFPAGTLSGAPKYKAMQIIDKLESTPRGYYGGAIGYLGFNGDANMAIMIRSFRSKGNCLYYQAGAGVVVKSIPANELQEVNNKIAALRSAIALANKNLK